MRVGLIANTFYPNIGAVAGGHVHFLEVARRWADVDVWVFAPAFAAPLIKEYLPNSTFVAMPTFGPFESFHQLRNLTRTILSVRCRAALRSCDVLLATSHFLPDVVPALFGRYKRMVVCVQHVLDPPWMRPGNVVANSITSLFQEVSFWLIRMFASAIFVNTFQTAEKVGVRSENMRITLMTNGVEHFLDCADTISPPREPGHVTYLGRLVATKGVDDLLRAWAKVRARNPAARLTIAGSGEPGYVAYLESLARDLGIADTVCFVGRISEAAKADLLRRSVLFAFPSKEEGWGIVLAEAMACGVPCLTYDLPAYHPFERGRMSVPVGDVTAFASVLQQLLDDDGLLIRLSREASALSTRFTWKAAAEIERGTLLEIATQGFAH